MSRNSILRISDDWKGRDTRCAFRQIARRNLNDPVQSKENESDLRNIKKNKKNKKKLCGNE